MGFTHTHSSPFRNASAPVSVLCSKLEDNRPTKCVRAGGAIIFAWCGHGVPDPVRGAALGCWGCVCARDFSGHFKFRERLLVRVQVAKQLCASDELLHLVLPDVEHQDEA